MTLVDGKTAPRKLLCKKSSVFIYLIIKDIFLNKIACLCLFIYLPSKRNINFAALANCSPITALVRVKASILSSETCVCVCVFAAGNGHRERFLSRWMGPAITINSCLHSGSTPDSQKQRQHQRIVPFRMRERTAGGRVVGEGAEN